MNKRAISNYNIVSNDINLIQLLLMSDVHVTLHSTVAVEAIDFGICSVVVDEYGKNAFHEYIEQGDLYYASDYNQIKEIIENSDKRLNHSDPNIIIQNENQKFDTIMNYILQIT